MFGCETRLKKTGKDRWSLEHEIFGEHSFDTGLMEDICKRYNWSVSDGDIADKLMMYMLALEKRDDILVRRGIICRNDDIDPRDLAYELEYGYMRPVYDMMREERERLDAARREQHQA